MLLEYQIDKKKSLKAVFLEAEFAVNSLSFTSHGVFDNIQKASSKILTKNNEENEDTNGSGEGNTLGMISILLLVIFICG